MHKVQKKPRSGGKLSSVYYLRYRYGNMAKSAWKSLGVADLQTARKYADDFRKDWERNAAGLLPNLKERTSAAESLSSHLSEYIDDMLRRGKGGRKGKNAKLIRTRIQSVFSFLKWSLFRDVAPSGLVLWRRDHPDLSAKTLNHYLEAVTSFFNWCVETERLPRNPVKGVKKVDVRGKEVRSRRALTDDELRRLIEAAPQGRGLVYFFAARTGLRFGEMQQLRWSDVNLDLVNPWLRVRASTTKNKKTVTLPLISELAERLAAYRETQDGTGFVFASVPRCRTLQKDLKAAGIPYFDESGRVADFHAFRKAFSTFLQVNDLGPRFTMFLMRHSSVDMSAQEYMDERHLPIASRLRGLPRLLPNEGEEHIWVHNSVPEGQIESAPVAKERLGEKLQDAVAEAFRHLLSAPDALTKLVEVAGVEIG